MRRFLVVVCCMGLMGVAPSAAARPAAACEDVVVESYDLAISGVRSVYRVGDTLEGRVLVTRKDTGMPVGDARVVLAIFDRDETMIAGFATSDSEGIADVSLSLDKARPAVYDLMGYAYTGVETTCVAVREYGFEYRKEAVRIRK